MKNPSESNASNNSTMDNELSHSYTQEELKMQLDGLHHQLIEQEKLAALGSLVPSITHEINTPIGIGITTTTHLSEITREIQKSFSAGKITQRQFKDYLDSVAEASRLLFDNLNRAVDLIRSFKQMAVDQNDELALEICVKETLDNIIKSIRPEMRKKHLCNVELECDPSIKARTCPGSIAQVITNLVMNAGIHAFDDGHSERNIRIKVTVTDDQFNIEISDNGKGIPEELRPKVFEPFMTTRRNSGGSGLGLNIVKKLVEERLNGSISLISETGKFTCFSINLPRFLEAE